MSEQALIEERACSRSPELIKQPIKREKPLGVILDFSQRKPKKEKKRNDRGRTILKQSKGNISAKKQQQSTYRVVSDGVGECT